jgi:high-affinity nickel-transport protein
MHDLPTDWSALCALVFLLGMRHGFDADHLAAIDGLRASTGDTRRVWRAAAGPCFPSAMAPWCWALRPPSAR